MVEAKGLQRPVPSLVISSVLAAVFLIVNIGLYRVMPSFHEFTLDNAKRAKIHNPCTGLFM